MAAETQHSDLAADSTLAGTFGWVPDELRTAFLVAAYGVAHALALVGAVLLTVTLAGVLPGGAVGLVGTVFGGLAFVAAAPALVSRGFAAALDAHGSDTPR